MSRAMAPTPRREVARDSTIPVDKITSNWGDLLRVAGSLTTGAVRGYDLLRMLGRDGEPTGLGAAFAAYGRIFKTLHILHFVHDEGFRRMIGTQLNVIENRHRLAQRISFGHRGELANTTAKAWKTNSGRWAWRSTRPRCGTAGTSTTPSNTSKAPGSR